MSIARLRELIRNGAQDPFSSSLYWKDSPSPPPPPDYTGAAKAQGAANVDTARVEGRMNNPNIWTPYGNQVVEWYGDHPTIIQSLNPQSQKIFNEQQNVRLGLAQTADQGVDAVRGTLGEQFNFNGPAIDKSVADPGAVGLRNPFDFGKAGANITPGAGISKSVELREDPVTAGALAAGPQGGQYGAAGSVEGGRGIRGGPSLFEYGSAQRNVANPQLQRSIGDAGNISNEFDLSGVAKSPINAGMTAQNAIMSRLSPQLQREQELLNTRLRNQGLVAGGEAYDAEANLQNQKANDLMTQAALYGLNLDMSANQQGFQQAQAQGLFGNQAQQQRFGQNLAGGQFSNQAAGQQFGQNLQAGQFGNQAIQQDQQAALQQQQAANQAQQQQYSQLLGSQQLQNQAISQNFGQHMAATGLQNQQQQQRFQQGFAETEFLNQARLAEQAAQNSAQQQLYGQQMGVQGMQNQAIQQNQQADLQRQQAINAARAQQFNQGLSQAQFANQARQQMLQEQLYQRNLPINEVSALMSGSQIQNPQFQQYQGGQVQPPPIFNATGQQAQYNQGLYNAQMGQANSFNQGLMSLGSAGIMAYGLAASDRRLKSNIVRVGTHPLGIGIYEYDLFGERETGVMADEVMTVKPEAVAEHPSGYLMVDYGRL